MTSRPIAMLAPAVLVLPALAGPIDPPPGPVSSTYKTLTEVEPRTAVNAANTPGDADSVFRITQPGSYYLTGNVAGVAGKSGIEIAASGVTLDLNGFSIIGVPGSIHGIDISGVFRATIRNGLIVGFGGSGIEGGTAQAEITAVKVAGCTGNGISINSGSYVRDCLVAGCGGTGFYTSNDVIIENCISGSNGVHGFQVGTDSIVRNCLASGNVAGGITTSSVENLTVTDCIADYNGSTGIAVNDRSSISGCVSRNNREAGISAGIGSLVRGCSATDNGTDGILTLATCTITDSTASGNGDCGIETTSSTVTNCTARDNANDGIAAGSGSVISHCVAASNDDDGIAGGSGHNISHCAVRDNGNDGIYVGGDCTILSNNCDNNGVSVAGAGIHIPDAAVFFSNADTRIEGNNVTDNDYGIRILETGCLVIRNSASSNGTANYSIIAGNTVGAILSVAGNGSFSSSNAWANLEF